MPNSQSPHTPPKRNFSERLFPARPRQLLKKTRVLAQTRLDKARSIGVAKASNPGYVRWLRNESMLHAADKLATRYSGSGAMWQNPFARPRPRTAIKLASVWYTAYPISLINPPGVSTIKAMADPDLWEAFAQIGIRGLHTGPVKRAGGLRGYNATPSIDGHFDRISTKIDSVFGTAAEFKRMSQTAAEHDCIVIDDIVPGHTGKGADFRLAEMAYRDYPGIYHMVEIAPRDWGLLPEVESGRDSANIDSITEAALKTHGYIIGKLSRVIFYEPGIKDTNWSVTRPIRGVDGVKRRWVYLHYFKDGQPSINWLDPSFAGMKLVIGDALHSIGELGSSALRLDANGFLGIEVGSEDLPAWSEGHPLSGAANQLISGMVRKIGGFTFQELNLSIDDIKILSEDGADLSYDFVNRPAYHHALITGDTEFLRLTLNTSLEIGVDPVSLIHALQNHDELTYELVHFWTVHKDDDYSYHGQTLKGLALRDIIRDDLQSGLTDNKPYNLLFTTNGVACTTATVIAAAIGITDIKALTDQDIEQIKTVHLLLAMFNAFQPGVFALSGWDLAGCLTLDANQVADLTREGDTRWVNRGAYDLLGKNPAATQSDSGMPLARSLYGPLPQQLADPNSFAARLKDMLNVRERYNIAVAEQLSVPDVSHKSMLVMIHRLLETSQIQVTVLNFSNEAIMGTLSSDYLKPGLAVIDMFNDLELAEVDNLHSFSVTLEPYQGMSLLIK